MALLWYLEFIFYSKWPIILKHYLLIVTIIVYHVSSIQVSVFIQRINILSQHIILKMNNDQSTCLHTYLYLNHMLCRLFFNAMLFEYSLQNVKRT